MKKFMGGSDAVAAGEGDRESLSVAYHNGNSRPPLADAF